MASQSARRRTTTIDPIEPTEQDQQLTRTPRSRSWLWPAIAIAAVLIVVVAVGRLGQTPTQAIATTAGVALTQPTALSAGPRATLNVFQRPVYAADARLIGPPVGIRTDTDRYNDGIPAQLDDAPVLRVRDAAALPSGSVALVGGWSRRATCPSGEGANECIALLSDIPFRSVRVAALAMGGQAAFDYSEGPRIYRASVQPDPSCTFTAFETCLPRLNVGRALWSGDDDMASSPIDPTQLLGALGSRFPTLDFQPFAEASSCPVSWPVQSYVVSQPDMPRIAWPGLEVRLVLLFSSTTTRAAVEPGMRRAAAAMTPFDASNRCVAIPQGVDDNAWIVRDNAMILLGRDEASVRAQVNSALDVTESLGHV